MTCKKQNEKNAIEQWSKHTVVPRGYPIGTIVTYDCIYRSRTFKRTCQSNGQWSGSRPDCRNY